MKPPSNVLSFRADPAFITQTQRLADELGYERSDYVRKAVDELNQRELSKRLDALCTRLGSRNAQADADFDVTIADGL